MRLLVYDILPKSLVIRFKFSGQSACIFILQLCTWEASMHGISAFCLLIRRSLILPLTLCGNLRRDRGVLGQSPVKHDEESLQVDIHVGEKFELWVLVREPTHRTERIGLHTWANIFDLVWMLVDLSVHYTRSGQ